MEENKSDKFENEYDDSFHNEEMEMFFPVDLTREEFVRFNLIVAKTNGILRYRKGQMILFGVLGFYCLSNVIIGAVEYKTADPIMVLLTLFIAAVECLFYFGMTAYVSHASGRAYDQTKLNGNSYYGHIYIYRDRIEKKSTRTNTSISLDEKTLYIETKDMMILLSQNNPAIVLSARCMTKENADFVRKAIMARIPAVHEILKDRMIPLATEPIAPPENREDDEIQESEQMHVDISYSQKEFIKLATDTAQMGFMKALPIYSGLSVVAGLLFGLLYNFGVGLIVFIVCIGSIFTFNILGVRSRANRSYSQLENNNTKIRISFTDKGITIHSPEARESMGLIWESITRAVERKECIEFYTQSSFLRIPKHCIEDIGLLKNIVDSHIHHASAEKQ